MPKETVTVTTHDGECPVYVFTPENRAASPAVVLPMLVAFAQTH
jgi:hypothetical protein